MKKVIALLFIATAVFSAPPGRPLIPGTNQCQMYQDRFGNMTFVDAFTGPVTLQTLASGAGGSGTSIYPATATASFPFGLSASTLNVTGTGNNFFGTQNNSTVIYGQLSSFGGLYVSSSTSNGAGGIITSNYTTGCTDNVIFASAPPAGLTITLEAANLCASSTTINHVLQITKVNASTYPVTIVTSGTNLISGTTGLLVLNAIGQTDELVPDGVGTWWPHGQGIQVTPIYLGGAESNNSSVVATSSNAVVCPITVTVPVTVTAFRWFEGTNTGGSTATFGIYDQSGNLIVSTGPVPATTFGANSLAMPFTNLSPGQYYVATQLSNVNVAINGINGNGGNGVTWCSLKTATSMVLPNPFTFGTGALQAPFPFLVVAGGRTTQ